MKVTWDRAEDRANQQKHGVSFAEARELLTSGVEHLEIFDDAHSDDEDRFISIGPIRRGLVLVVSVERQDNEARIISARWATRRETTLVPKSHPEVDMTDIPPLTKQQLASRHSGSKRLMAGRFESGDDIAALRRFARLTQTQFARAMGISVHTLRNWEQGRRVPEGPAIALLRIAARHPRILRENLRSAA